MTDTVISARAKRRELWILISCFVVANIVNLYAIIHFHTSWREILTQLGYVVVITFLLYITTLVVRLLIRLLTGKGKDGV